jgi:hypothetical protein
VIFVFPWVNPNRKIRVKIMVVQQGSFFLDIATGEFHHVITHTRTSTGNVINPLKRGDFYDLHAYPRIFIRRIGFLAT